MPRYSEETKKDLRTTYVLAAEKLVAKRGWEGATVRKVAEAAGTSYGPIHEMFPGLGLKAALIEGAYLHLVKAIEWSTEEPQTLSDVFRIVVNYLRNDDEAAPLMVQVMALSAALKAPGADDLQDAIAKAWVLASRYIATRLGTLLSDRSQRAREIKAEALVDWYVVVCATLVMRCYTSNPDLIRLAEGFAALRDSCQGASALKQAGHR